jgi:TolB-like protein/Flp pilus assembly protein TadD
MVVLPFRNLSGDATQDFLGDGLAEEMITQLGALSPQRLGVIARTSSAQYKQTSRSARQIGSELQVGYVLEGSVRSDRGKLHVTAQLIQTSDQTQLWAATYDRDSADTLSIERDLAQRVAGSLALKLLPVRDSLAVSQFTQNPEAHDAYLRGRYEMNRMTLAGFVKARSYLEQAVRNDPSFALAHAALADTYSLEPWWGGMTPREAFPKARAAAERALQIDDNLAEAHTSLGFIRLYYDWDFAGAEREFERAVNLQPGLALAHYWYAGVLSAAGRHDEAMASMRRAQELDPLSPLINADAGWYYFHARRYDEAAKQCRLALELDRTYAFALACVIDAHRLAGHYDQAAEAARQMISLRAAQAGRTMPPLARGGREALTEFDRRKLAAMRQLGNQSYVSAYGLALTQAALGQREEAFASLERALHDRDTFMVLMNVDPRLDALRADARFAELKRKTGL